MNSEHAVQPKTRQLPRALQSTLEQLGARLRPLIEHHLSSWPTHGLRLTLERGAERRESTWGPFAPDAAETLPCDLGAGIIGTLRVSAGLPGGQISPRDRAALAKLIDWLHTVAQRSHTEWQLESQNARLEAMIDAAPLALYALSVEGLVEHWNLSAEQTFGVTRDEVIGRPAPGQLSSDAFSALRESLTNRQPRESVIEHLRPDGQSVTLQLSEQTVTQGGVLIGSVGSAQARSALNLQAGTLESHVALLESVLSHANDSVLITEAAPIDEPGPRIVYANAAFTRTTGYSLAEIIGRNPRLLQGPRSDDKMRARIRTALERWEPIEVELVNYRKDGSEFWVELSIAPVTDVRGLCTHWISIQRDITERKRLSEHLDRARSQVLERTAQGLPLEQVLEPLLGSLERQFEGTQASLTLLPEQLLFTSAATDKTWPVEWGTARLSASAGLKGLELRSTLSERIWLQPVSGDSETRLAVLAVYGTLAVAPDADDRARLEAAAALVALVLARRAAQLALEKQALFDALTELPNRTAFQLALERSLQRMSAKDSDARIAVGMIDLDRFKQVNDNLGHGAGDALLAQVAQRLRDHIRDQYLLARMGGDEFLILIDGLADGQALLEIGKQILQVFERPFLVFGHEMFVQASLGFSLSHPNSRNSERLLQQADAAMYQAKRQGGGVTIWSGKSVAINSAISLESALHRAVERDEFVLHYQPIVNPVTSRATGVEALLRWNHPERGLLLPGEFIALAEVTGLIVPIGAWVLEQACRAGKLYEQQIPNFRMAVNLSARQFQGGQLRRDVELALERSGLTPSMLELELTESLLMQVSSVNTNLLGLKQLGVRLVIDDFGTGYSSLAYLRNFPVDALKIDHSFIRELGNGGREAVRDDALVRAIIELAHALSLEVTVEGVERNAQREHLLQLRCHRLQGYYFARPLPHEALMAWLQRNGANGSSGDDPGYAQGFV